MDSKDDTRINHLSRTGFDLDATTGLGLGIISKIDSVNVQDMIPTDLEGTLEMIQEMASKMLPKDSRTLKAFHRGRPHGLVLGMADKTPAKMGQYGITIKL